MHSFYLGNQWVRGESINRNMRENVFIQRVWGIWNRLPQEVVEVGAIAAFKRLLIST